MGDFSIVISTINPSYWSYKPMLNNQKVYVFMVPEGIRWLTMLLCFLQVSWRADGFGPPELPQLH